MLTPLQRVIYDDGYQYEYVDAHLNRKALTVTLTVRAPDKSLQGAGWWPLQMSRELDDAILSLRTNELELGLWILKTVGEPEAVLAEDRLLVENQNDWFVREVVGMMRRTLARLDVSSRSIYAVVEPGSCFALSLLELALAADRAYMLDVPEASLALSEMNFGPLPMLTRISRIAARFYQDHGAVETLRARLGTPLSAQEALELGRTTSAPADLGWAGDAR